MKYDNVTDPIFRDTTCTNTVNLGITTLCSMDCPSCSLDMPGQKASNQARHASLLEISEAAIHLRNLRRLNVTGGEPTLHPDFEYLAERLRSWFNPKYLTIETNGTYYPKYRHLFQCFDRVFITHYVKDQIYEGNFDNTAIIEQAAVDLKDKLIREPPVVHERTHPLNLINGKDKPCSKWYDPGLAAGWYNGKIYKCCVSFGIDRDLGIPLDKDWRMKVLELDMGCKNCLFQGT